MLTKRQLRNSNNRWQRKMLPMKVRHLEAIAKDKSCMAESLAVQRIIHLVVIAVLGVWIIYLLEARR